MKQTIILMLVLCASVCSAQNQSNSKATTKEEKKSFMGEVPKTISASVGQTLMFVESNFFSVAEAMPEDKYDYVPTAGKFYGARSFGEQVKHVACAQFAFFNEF